LLEELTADNLEPIQVIFKINLLLSQSIMVLGFSQKWSFIFHHRHHLRKAVLLTEARLCKPNTRYPGRGVLPQNFWSISKLNLKTKQTSFLRIGCPLQNKTLFQFHRSAVGN